VVVERPYKLYERPRARGPVQASLEDEELGRWNVGGTGDPDFMSNRPAFHPGTRVVVDLAAVGRTVPIPRSASRGPSPEQRYLAQARKHGYWPFRLCFEEGLGKNPKIHGKTEFRVSVHQVGRVRAVRLVSTRLEDREVVACLGDRVKELVFTPPRRTELLMAIELWPGDVPIELAAPPRELENPGKLEPEALLKVAQAATFELVRCYREGLVRDPALWGRLELRIEQDKRGALARISEQTSHFPDRKTALCAVDTLRGLTWPGPTGGRLSWVLGLRFGRMPPRGKVGD
jgi:hypothetical protein